jgi:DNA replication and repair protein RecF
MRIDAIQITDFRNLKNLEIKDFEKINIIQGLNAQGKTNLVEAIAYLSLAESFRNDENVDLINYQTEFARISATISKGLYHHELKAVISKASNKLFFDNKELKKVSDFIGIINVVTFSPEDVFLFKGSPRNRRDFLNKEISKISPSYYLAKNQLTKLLKERNELLKSSNIDRILLETYDLQLARANSEIAKKRKDFLEKLEDIIHKEYRELIKKDVDIKIEYLNQFEGDYHTESIKERLKESYQDDIQKGSTQIGVQKDDFVLKLDGKNVAHYGSQGQNRLAAIALKLATIKVVKDKTGEEAIVVLDDVLSELDENKRKELIKILSKENQVFLTTTEDEEFPELSKALKIKIVQGQTEGES